MLHSSSDLYGASKVGLETIKILKENGCYVVVALSSNGPLCKEIISLDCPVEIIPLATVRRKYFNLKGLFNRTRAFRNSLRELDRIAKLHDIDTIYSNTTGVVTGAFYSKRKKLKHVWHVLEIIPGPKWLLKAYAYLMLHYSDCVIVVSEAVKSHWLKVNRNLNIHRLYNGFSIEPYSGNDSLRDELRLPSDLLLIGMIARVHFWKGQSYFLEIASLLKQKYHNIKFVMVGDAFPGYEYLYDELKQIIKENNLEDAVIDLGYRTDINRILQSLDIFVLPSILPDPLPTTVLEAMACGKPVVATNHGGAPEMVKLNETGLLIPWDNAHIAAKTILPLIEDGELRKVMGEKGKIRVNEVFSYEQHRENLIAIMNSI